MKFFSVNKAFQDLSFLLKVTGSNFEVQPPHNNQTVVLPYKQQISYKIIQKDPNQPWKVQWDHFYEIGNPNAKHDDNYLYSFPFSLKNVEVGQSFNGTFSHYGKNSYALDFLMPEGTTILAARDGRVVGVKSDSDVRGETEEFVDKGNYVQILHSDHTVGHYVHLKKDGVDVQPGQDVKTGNIIGKSGNTGRSTAPHLHFHVWQKDTTVPFQLKGPHSGFVPKKGDIINT